ncbi:MAG TPA: ABC transporter permease [Anaerovoracaceae bacterium]|nr:ABC transporter permease [Anaerovoracaceae bacterium]
MKKMFVIFSRDLKVNIREFLSLYIIIVPLIFGIAINLIAPSVNDTTVNLALIEDENPEMEEYLEDFAKVSLHEDEEALDERIARRDEVFAYVPDGESYYILAQGNETEQMIDIVAFILASYEDGAALSESTAQIHEFGEVVSPLKKLLVNIMMMFSAVLGGMLIAINIIEEKVDKTIRAVNLSTISKTGYIFGKSLIGAFIPLYGSVSILLITGFSGINWLQMMMIVLVSMIISILFGFIQGINNSSVMDAAGSVKMLFLPLAGSVAVAELLSDKWQWVVYWSPFYWTYKGVDKILTYQAEWQEILMYSGIVVLISVVVYILLMPRIRKGLS